MLPYGRQSLDEDDIEAVVEVLRSDWLTTGPVVSQFESALAAEVGGGEAVVVNSGTAALHAAYFACGLGEGDVLVTTPLTFVATANAALHLGASVRFADVDPQTGNLDPEGLAAWLSPDVRAVTAVDFGGHVADYAALRRAIGSDDVTLIGDSAHSLGAQRDGRAAGCLADISTTSFHPVKIITTGEGGALFSNRAEWCERARSFRDHGFVRDRHLHRYPDGPWYAELQHLGLNYRLPDILCALGLRQLSKLGRFIERRREIAEFYQRELASVSGIELPAVEAGVEPSWHLYVIRVRDAVRRLRFFERLRCDGIGVQLHYPPVHLQPLYRDLGNRPGSLPRAEDFAARALSLPLFPAMSESDPAQVVEIVTKAALELL